MEGSIKSHDKEQVKMVMLQQEETFRYQLRELHRLYRIQMLLTRDSRNARMEMKMQRSNLESWNDENEITSLEFAAEDRKGETSGKGTIEADEESHLELTLATGSNRTTQRKKKGEDAAFTSDSGSSFSSSSNESGTMKHYRNEWASFEGPKVEQQMKQDALNNPPWLLKCNNNHDMVASFGL